MPIRQGEQLEGLAVLLYLCIFAVGLFIMKTAQKAWPFDLSG